MDFTKMTDVDAAYYILQNNGEEPMYYKDLILKTIDLKKKPVRRARVARLPSLLIWHWHWHV